MDGFVRLSYGYLPLAWGANVAFWSAYFLKEVGVPPLLTLICSS